MIGASILQNRAINSRIKSAENKMGEGRQSCVNAKKQQQLTESFSHGNR